MDGVNSFHVACPYCGESLEIFVEDDVRGTFVQDCEVCCNPWLVRVTPRRTDRRSASDEPTDRMSPSVPLIALGIFIVLAFIALIPFSLIQRFRLGTMRRRAIRWIIGLNFAGRSSRRCCFSSAAAITTRWVRGR